MQEFANCDILHLKKNCRKELNEIFYSQSTLPDSYLCNGKNCMVGIWEAKPKVAKNDQKLTNGDILHFKKKLLNPVERNFPVSLHHTRFLYKQWQLNCKAGI